MNTIREFFVNLRKSTKITLISCVSFVLMTFLILCFFIISPITPDDKAGSTYGRETVSGSVISTDVTTIAGEGLEVSKGTSKAATTTKVTTSHVDYVITITTGAGFYTGGRINTGDYTGDYDYNQNGNYNAEEEQGGIGYYDPNSSVNNNNGSGNASGNGENGNGGETGYNNNGGETGNGNNGGGNASGNGGESGYNNNGGESGNGNNGGGNASGNGGAANGGETGNNNNGGETGNGNSGGGNAAPEQPVQTPEQPVQNPVEGGGEAAGSDE
ncbi:MAG: hypothetical protein E7495_02945 [Ruminococcus flavefaciens]|jgi:hypothetical protein|nr:hypothetical protein [Ruminococcus flavefaciens]